MAAKTLFTRADIQRMLAHYEIGEVVDFYPAANGSVQTNYIVHTTCGKYILRYYETRNFEEVQFELSLLEKLAQEKFPCAAYRLPCTHKL